MDLTDALDGNWPGSNPNQPSGGSQWPGQSTPAWPGQPSNPVWPGQPPQPSAPAGFPGAPSGPGGFPGAPSGPGGFPGAPSGPGAFPGGPSNPSWNNGPSQPSFPGAPSQPGNPTFPSFPGGPSQPSQPSGPGFPSAQINLTVPFKQQFPGGLQDKKLITIRGKAKSNAVGFVIDMCTRSDLAFHFNPRFDEYGRQVVVCNTRTGGKWGKEERNAPCFPFRRGENFEIKVLVTHTCFKVAVNNSHLVEYNHRLNMREICGISVFGDCTLSHYNVEQMH